MEDNLKLKVNKLEQTKQMVKKVVVRLDEKAGQRNLTEMLRKSAQNFNKKSQTKMIEVPVQSMYCT